jgi:anti-sigma B factor antagonist
MSAAMIDKQGTTLSVCPEGKLDSVQTPQLEKELQPYLADTTQIAMDFSNVEYVSSAGLRLLLYLEQEMEKRGGEVQVAHAHEDILRVLELAGFMDVVHVIME